MSDPEALRLTGITRHFRQGRKTLEVLKREETIASVAPHVMSFKQFFDTARMAEVQELEARYGTPENSRTEY